MKFKTLDNNKKVVLTLIVVIITAGIVLRGLFLVADPPSDLSVSGALVGDAGQQSYGARNKILFDQWSFDDWKPHTASPLISILINYPVYKIFGINFYSHKIIPLFFSSITLIFFVFMIYRYFGELTCLISTIFLAFNYQIIIYSKVAIRYFPMIFFFILSLYFFIEGASKKKYRFFILSGVFFMLSFSSQNHILYLISLFFVLGILWILEKKIQIRHFFVFWGAFIVCFLIWYLIVLLPNKEFFEFFVTHNKLVRQVYHIKQLFVNVSGSPFMFILRNDPLLLLFSSIAVMLYVKLKLSNRTKIPFVIDASIMWLVIGTIFHSIWPYRPTRFYLVLIFPASLLAGWIISYLLRNKLKINFKFSGILSLISLHLFLIFSGIFKYSRFLKSQLSARPYLLICFFALLAILCLIIFLNNRKKIVGFVIILLLISAGSNLKYFIDWAKNREYKMINTANVLNRAIPPSDIAGNWASILSTGTPHRTHLLFVQMGVNWEKDFLKKHNISYLLLTRGFFTDELREYNWIFKEELSKSKRIALFKMYRSEVHLISLYNKHEKKGRTELESLIRDSGTVVYDPQASSRMALKFRPDQLKKPVMMEIGEVFSGDDHCSLKLSGKGNFKGILAVIQEGKTVKEGFLRFNSKNFQEKNILSVSLKGISKIALKISRTDGDVILDYIDFVRH